MPWELTTTMIPNVKENFYSQEENLTKETLLDGVEEILNNKIEYIESMKLNADRDSIQMIVDLINAQTN